MTRWQRRTVCAVILSALAGTLIFLSLPIHSITPLAFVAMVPLLLVAMRSSPRAAAAFGLVTGAVAHAGACAWVLPTIAHIEQTSTLLALPFFAAFALYQALPFVILAAGIAWTARHQRSATNGQAAVPIVFAASLWVLLEWGFPKPIPWSFGDTLADSRLLRQSADLAEVHGLSFLIMVVNACVAAAISGGDGTLARRTRPIMLAAVLLMVWGVYGAARVHGSKDVDPRPPTSDRRLTVMIVQGGLRSGRSDLTEANEDAWKTYSSLSTQDPARRSDLLVWPETTLRVYLRQDDVYRRRVLNLVHRLGQPLFLGSLDLPPDGPGELNSGYLFQDDRVPESSGTQHSELSTQNFVPMQVYHKVHLLPFGEYVPGAAWLPFLSHWQTTGQFVAAESSHPLTLALPGGPSIVSGSFRRAPTDEPSAPTRYARDPPAGIQRMINDEHDSRARITTFAPSICFEAVLPGAFNKMVREGAAFLINITDDGWFGDSALPYQHLQAARLRAVETRRWLVRASNSGVSAFIDPTGEIVASMPLGATGVLRHAISTSPAVSVYARWGDWLVVVCFAVVSLQLARSRRNDRTLR